MLCLDSLAGILDETVEIAKPRAYVVVNRQRTYVRPTQACTPANDRKWSMLLMLAAACQGWRHLDLTRQESRFDACVRARAGR